MSTEDEFGRWLRRPGKSLTQNFEFALKAWQSADFTLASKYELVLKWVTEQGPKLAGQAIPERELAELLQLRAQPGLISQQTKLDFVEMMLKLQPTRSAPSRLLPQLLRQLCEFEVLQDLYRANYELQARVYAALLQHYETYLQQLIETPTKEETDNTLVFRPAHESEFFAIVLNSLKDNAKRAGDTIQFDGHYVQHVLQPLTQCLLLLRTRSLCFFEELLLLERQLTEQTAEEDLLKRNMQLPLHVRLLTLECAIVNRRGVECFLQLLLQRVFEEQLPAEQIKDPALALTVAAYTLEILQKHDVSLNFSVTKDQTAVVFLGKQLLSCVQQCKEHNLREVLLLLCAALHLNPLILEQNIFHITTWMIVAAKSGAEQEQKLFEDFLVQLMDMFRRLSRTEKLVNNLLKTLKDWLSKYELPKENTKRKAKDGAPTPAKKQKLKEGTTTAENSAQYPVVDEKVTYHLQILFKEFHKLTKHEGAVPQRNVLAFSSFPELQHTWPSASVGNAFAKLITGLVSKPSLVIWKSLLYSLKELLEQLQQENAAVQSENSLFLLDLHAALLCQYFMGARLCEQSDKFAKEISDQHSLTNSVIGSFGRFLLTHEHQKRTMNAFLECAFHASNFELLLMYYRPDGMEAAATKDTLAVQELHAFLSAQEWTLIQQRVLNFGKGSCKFLLNRLRLQRTQATYLLHPQEANIAEINLEKSLLSSTYDDRAQLELLLKSAHAQWLVAQLKREQKVEIARALLEERDLLKVFVEDLEALEVLTLVLYERLHEAFAASCKGSFLSALNCDFKMLLQRVDATNALDKHIQALIGVINERSTGYTVKKLPIEAAKTALETLNLLPIGHLRRQHKCLLFALHLTLYSDLMAAGDMELAQKAFDILTDLLHFGQHVPVFKYFPTETFIKLLPVASCWKFYEFLFVSVRNEEKGTEQFLAKLVELLTTPQSEGELSDDQRRLLLIAIETLSSMSGPPAKRLRKQLDSFLAIYADYINSHFKPGDDSSNAKKHKKFVEKTLAGFAPYVSALLVKAGKSEEESKVAVVDEHFRRICKIYIGHSMDYRNPHAIRLIQVALNHRQLLHLDQDEIEFVLSHYWRQVNEDLRAAATEGREVDVQSTENVIKIIIGHKTNEDLLLTLKELAAQTHSEKGYVTVTRCLALIAKCPFSTIKGAIFNEQFKQITCDLILRLAKNEHQQYIDNELVLRLLNAQQSIIENKMIPISLDTLDSVLTFLIDINIKKFPISDANASIFYKLHLAMSELCSALIKQRHILLMDRVPQFVHIFKDLLQSLVWYKSERQKDTALSDAELDELAEMAQRLEALMHIIATHGVNVKRVAPFVLTFVINLMVANKRPTTLYPKIKTHIESICYDLIGVCDHRVGRFILRCSNEAARQVYELLVKDHKKYHKFKGKV